MAVTPTGHIKFIDPQKTEYNLDDIIELIEFNFGYSPFKSGKTKEKTGNSKYNNLAHKIHNSLRGKELAHSKPRNNLYSKADVYRFLSSDAYKYLLKASKTKEEYDRKVKDAQIEFQERMKELSTLDSLDVRVEKKKKEVKLNIILDYICKHFININEELIEDDIYFCENLGGRPIEDLSDSEILIYSRLHGNGSEYYTIKE